jgi:hypothetical protein
MIITLSIAITFLAIKTVRKTGLDNSTRLF